MNRNRKKINLYGIMYSYLFKIFMKDLQASEKPP